MNLFQLIENLELPSPDGCWNCYGYLDDFAGGAYAYKDAVQMKAVYDMIVKASGMWLINDDCIISFVSLISSFPLPH